ncbi:Titin, partial [Eumeta japonica]
MPEEKKWPTGRRKRVEEEKKEEVVLKPIPKPKKPEEEEQPEEVSLKPVPKTKPEEEMPEEKKWPTGRRKRVEEEKKEEVVLKPIPKPKKPEEEEQPEEVSLKPVPKTKPEEEMPEEKKWPTGRRKRVEEEKKEEVVLKPIPKPKKPEEEEQPEEVSLKPVPKTKPEEEMPEEKKWPTGRRKRVEEEKKEEVVLKPIPKPKKPEEEEQPEEVSLKPVRKSKPEEEIPEENKWPTGRRKQIEEEKKEEVVLKPIPKPLKPEEEEQPEEVSLKPIPRPKLKSEEEMPEEKKWPTGRRKQIIEEKKEEVVLKPIPRPMKPEEEEQPEEVSLKPIPKPKPKPEEEMPEEKKWPTGRRKQIVEEKKEEVVLKPISKPMKPEEEEQPEEVSLKPIPKLKPKPEEEMPEEKKWPTGRRKRVEEEKKEEVVLKPIPKPKKPEEEEQPEEISLKPVPKTKPEEEIPEEKKWPTGRRKRVEEEKKEEVVLKPIPKPKEPEKKEQPEEVTLKPVMKPKPEEEKPEEKKQLTEQKQLVEQEQIQKKTIVKETIKEETTEERIIHQPAVKKIEDTELSDEETKEEQMIETVVKRTKKKTQKKSKKDNFDSESANVITCRAENVAGSVSCSASLTLEEGKNKREGFEPTFIESLKPITVMDGEPISLKCVLIGEPFPKVHWTFNSKPIQKAKDTEIIRQQSGFCELTIKEAFPEMAGKYSCIAINEFGCSSSESVVTIEAYEYVASEEEIPSDEKTSDLEEFAPRIVKTLPTVISTTEGELTRLEAKAIGVPKPKIKWYKHGLEIKQSSEYQIEEMEDGTSILIIPEVYQDDSGEIKFEAYNPLGVTATVAALSVESIIGTKEYRKPEWVTHMEELQAALRSTQAIPTFVKEIMGERVHEEETVVFEAIYSGNPVPDKTLHTKCLTNLKRKRRASLPPPHDRWRRLVVYLQMRLNIVSNVKVANDFIVLVSDFPYVPFTSKRTGQTKFKDKHAQGHVHPPRTSDSHAIDYVTTSASGHNSVERGAEILWYKDDKIIRSDEFYIIENKDNKTTCTIKKVSKVAEGTYMCKAVSDIGMAITKANLQVFKPGDKMKKVKAKETREKILSEKTKDYKPTTLEKGKATESVEEIQDKATIVTDDITIADAVPITPIKKEKAKAIVTEAEHVETVDIASYKKVDKKLEKTPQPEEVDMAVTPHEHLVTTKQEKEETVESFTEKTIEKYKAILKLVEKDTRMAAEVNELLEVINAKEFGPGESPLRELAAIGYMLRNGVTTEQIQSLYDSEYFPSLRVPQAQSALVHLVERQGHGTLITEVLTEETTQDEDTVAAKVGFRAFLKMVEMKHTSVEEVIAHFYPEDFKPRSWEQKEAHEVIEESTLKHVAESRITDVIQDKGELPSTVKKSKVKDVKKSASKKREESEDHFKDDESEIVEVVEETVQNQKQSRMSQLKKSKSYQESIEEDEINIIDDEKYVYKTLIPSEIPESKIEIVSSNQVANILTSSKINDQMATIKMETRFPLVSQEIKTEEKEQSLEISEKHRQSIKSVTDTLEPLEVSETETMIMTDNLSENSLGTHIKASQSIMPIDSILTAETLPQIALAELGAFEKHEESAKTTIPLQDAIKVTEQIISLNEAPLAKENVLSSKASVAFSTHIGVNVVQMEDQLKEQ